MESYWHYPIICPYYIQDKRQKIVCEDDFQIAFDNKDDAKKYMKRFCTTWDFKKCPHAEHMNQKYERGEEHGKKSNE